LIIFVLFGTATCLPSAPRRPHLRIGKPVPELPEISKELDVGPDTSWEQYGPNFKFQNNVIQDPAIFTFPPQDFREAVKGMSKEERAEVKEILTKGLGDLKCPRPHIHNPDQLHLCKHLNVRLDILEKNPELDVVPELPEITTERHGTGLLIPPEYQEELGPGSLPFGTEDKPESRSRELLKGMSKEERANIKEIMKKDLDNFKCSRPHIHNPDHLHNKQCKDSNAILDILEELDVVPELPEISTEQHGTGLLPPPQEELGPPFRTKAFREWLKGVSKEELAKYYRKMLKDMSKEEKVKTTKDVIKDLNDLKCAHPHIHNPDNLHDSALCKDLNTYLVILDEKL